MITNFALGSKKQEVPGTETRQKRHEAEAGTGAEKQEEKPGTGRPEEQPEKNSYIAGNKADSIWNSPIKNSRC